MPVYSQLSWKHLTTFFFNSKKQIQDLFDAHFTGQSGTAMYQCSTGRAKILGQGHNLCS
jgi:hypothetical protein